MEKHLLRDRLVNRFAWLSLLLGLLTATGLAVWQGWQTQQTLFASISQIQQELQQGSTGIDQLVARYPIDSFEVTTGGESAFRYQVQTPASLIPFEYWPVPYRAELKHSLGDAQYHIALNFQPLWLNWLYDFAVQMIALFSLLILLQWVLARTSKTVMRPLYQLASEVKYYPKNKRLDVHAQDSSFEFQHLFNGFRDMANELDKLKEEFERKQHALEAEVHIDEITKLPTRTRLQTFWAHLQGLDIAENIELTLLHITNLKQVNREQGYGEVNKQLRALVEYIDHEIHSNKHVKLFRLNGSDFLIVKESENHVVGFKRMQAAIEEQMPFQLEIKQVELSNQFSLGDALERLDKSSILNEDPKPVSSDIPLSDWQTFLIDWLEQQRMRFTRQHMVDRQGQIWGVYPSLDEPNMGSLIELKAAAKALKMETEIDMAMLQYWLEHPHDQEVMVDIALGTIQDKSFIHYMEFQQANLVTQSIVFAIEAKWLLEDFENCRRFINQARHFVVKVALTNVVDEPALIEAMKRIEVDFIMLHPSLVSDSFENEAMIESLSVYAKKHEQKVIACNVNDHGEFDRLQETRIDYFVGSLF